jgi:hypothetical protein
MANRPQRLGKLLRSSSGLNRLITRAHEQRTLLARVRNELPPPLDRHCLAALERDGRLLLYTDSPAWSSRLRFHARALSRQLQAQGLEFNRITVRVMAPGESKQRGPARNRAKLLSRENAAMIRSVAQSIDDPGLQSALQRLADKSRS